MPLCVGVRAGMLRSVIRGVITDSHTPCRARALLVGAAALASVFFLAPRASAGIADPDPSFSGDGQTTVGFGSEASADAIAVAPDGDLVVVGAVGLVDNRDFAVARLNPNGTLDSGFSEDGRLTVDLGGDERATGVAVRADGRIAVAGTSTDRFAVLQLQSDGSPDETFAADGSVQFGFGDHDEGFAQDVVLDAAGNTIVVGYGSADGADDVDMAIARVAPTGELDDTFASDGKLTAGLDRVESPSSDHASAVTLLPSGEIAIAGDHFQAPNGNGLFGRVDGSGSIELLESLGSGRYYGARDIAVLADGTPVTVGYYQPHGPPGGSAMAWSFDASGADEAWDFAGAPDVRAQANSIAPLADGNAVVSGAIGRQGNLFLLDPSSETGFVAHAPIGFAASEVALSDGKTVAAGSAAGQFAVARFLAPTIDTPNTKIVAGPKGKVTKATVSFRFRARPGAASFECKLDGRRWRSCDSPARLGGLDAGRHRFRVRAVSGDGERDPTPAKRRFKVA